ncbi:RNA-directed DNA polymerase [Sphingomonas lutea]|uniref:RNA-directed DNA polymerase n=1 Tax=Sphingomonas lutea TaxID=1045317 RepID=A0A7G9SKF4_9SPHN|nr:RNA-directed DNA polymerase [Sphingomonas lutea]QNN68329.1 RNA-directed DNA polymerase [Sphingomonas lutea]
MATFGLDGPLIKRLKKEVDVGRVRQDQFNDFFVLPQLDAIYVHCADKLKDLVAEKLSKSAYGPKSPIEMEVPKGTRVSTRQAPIIGPNYFRPGTVLLPEDRIVYHFIGQEAQPIAEKGIDRDHVYSYKPAKKKGEGFLLASGQWTALREAFEIEATSGKYTLVLKCDVAQYFTTVNQHELVNQLEHQGFSSEMVKFTERFLGGLTIDRSSRGLVQGSFGSDVLGNAYLIGVDEFVGDSGLAYYRYVDDYYILFETQDQLKDLFPRFVKRLREYDLALNESKSFITLPKRLLRDETELDKAFARAKAEAEELLTDYEEVEVEGDYGSESYIETVETVPDQEEVELAATHEIFDRLEEFKGDERDRAEAFCLAFFRRASDPAALDYVLSRWARSPDKAKEYALYLNRFVADEKHRPKIDKAFVDAAEQMLDFQWAWAALIARRMTKVSGELLALAAKYQSDGDRHEVVRSLLTYIVCRQGSPARKKAIRDGYAGAPLLVQLATLHASGDFTSAEQAGLLTTAEAHGELQGLMCDAVRAAKKAAK